MRILLLYKELNIDNVNEFNDLLTHNINKLNTKIPEVKLELCNQLTDTYSALIEVPSIKTVQDLLDKDFKNFSTILISEKDVLSALNVDLILKISK